MVLNGCFRIKVRTDIAELTMKKIHDKEKTASNYY